MKNREAIRKRFLKDPLPVKLGNLASNLSRISYFCQASAKNSQVLNDVLEESKFFIEWVAPETNLELAEWLVQMQIKLGLWQLSWCKTENQTHLMKQMSILTEQWSDKLLTKAGLL